MEALNLWLSSVELCGIGTHTTSEKSLPGTTKRRMVIYPNAAIPRVGFLKDGIGLCKGLSHESNTTILNVGKASKGEY